MNIARQAPGYSFLTLSIALALALATLFSGPVMAKTSGPPSPALKFSTYLGAEIKMVRTDARGDVYVLGTASGNEHAALQGQGDFVARLSADGSRIVFVHYFQSGLRVNALAVDPNGASYVTGFAYLPVLATNDDTAVQRQLNEGNCGPILDPSPCGDAFVAVLSPVGRQLYGTYLGGSARDEGSAIAVDASGDIYVAGTTESRDFPTANAFQLAASVKCASPDGNCSHAFVAKISTQDPQPIYSTYLTGSQGASISSYSSFAPENHLVVDRYGNAYVSGITFSKDFPVTPNAFMREPHSSFLAKLDPTGHLDYSTYFPDYGYSGPSVAVNGAGEAYLTGTITGNNFPVTGHAFQKHYHGGKCHQGEEGGPVPCTDAYVSKLSADGSKLLYSSYLGGEADDQGTAVAVDGQGRIWVGGGTDSKRFPVARALRSHLPVSRCDYEVCLEPFLVELNASGNKLLFGTYLGRNHNPCPNHPCYGGADNVVSAVAVSGQTILVSGTTDTTWDFPLMRPLQPLGPGGFVLKLHL